MAECLESGGGIVTTWLISLLDVCFASGMVPINRVSACVIPLYNVRGVKCCCASFRNTVSGQVSGFTISELSHIQEFWKY